MRKPPSANRPVMSLSSRLATLVAASTLAALGAACDVGDQLCPEGTNYNEKDDDCPYGPPGGPKREAVACGPAPARSGGDCTGVTWSATVFPILDNKVGAGCTNNGCHGDIQNKVLLPPGDADAVYAALTAYRIPGVNSAYINAADPSTSWITCNLREPAIGTKMPLGLTIQAAEVQTIELWLGCGAPK
jgi:hypothetical protein